MRLAAPILLSLLLAMPAGADPNPQLARTVAQRLASYGVTVDPTQLTTAQASALHILLVSEHGYLPIRRKARAILRNPDFAD